MADPATRATRDGHEPDAPSLRTLGIGAGVIVVMVALAIGVALGIVRTGPPVSAALPPPTAVAAPRLQPTPEADIAAYRRDQEALLHGYAWVDRAHGIVRMPIEQAMALLASRQPLQAQGR